MNWRIVPVIAVLWSALARADGEAVSFDRQVRPLLAGCFKCHGPDPSSRKADLRLDIRDGAMAAREDGAAIVPGDPDASQLIARVASADPGFRMPPADVGDPLSADQVAVLRAWIAQGAEYTKHWAFVPPRRPEPPAVADASWSKSPIDHFVLSRLEREGLAPSAGADRATLVRRLYLDLIGLPPSIEELESALADKSDGWYDALVERLLASPHYGERWARFWMDAAQYADSDGFEKDKPRFVWAWRDWVIRAFNEDMPFDRFVVQQVAGDMLPNATQDQLVATGFLRNSMINEEGGIDPEQFRMEAQFNRMDIIGRAVLGLTVSCAQCHTHKYDPLTHTEYYAMLAFLNNEHEACITVYSEEERRQRDAILALVREIEDGIQRDHPDWRTRMAAWEAEIAAEPRPTWETLTLTFDDTSAGGQKCVPQGDGSYLAQGYAPTQFHPKMTATPSLKTITAVRLELLTDPNLPRNGPGRSIYGACALSEFELRIAPLGTPIEEYDKWTNVKLAAAIADVNPPQRALGGEFPDREGKQHRVTGPAMFAIDGKPETAWTTDTNPETRNQPHEIVFMLAEPLTVPENSVIAVRPSQLHGGWNSDDNQNNNLGRFRFSVTDSASLPRTVLPEPVRVALATDADARTEDHWRVLFAQWRATLPELAEENARITALLQAIPSGTTQLVLRERETPRITHRLERGNFLTPAEPVSPGVPAFLHALESDGAPDRLDFARWLVDRDSPTTARAFVNRVWQQFFGNGLSNTTADLGTQGEVPSHPELLDWLAVEFMESGWKVKSLHRLIVRSQTYRQASRVTPELLENDPYNRLLARGARFRVEGETVRDIALAAGGLLNPTVGGPSVYPPAPDFLFQPPASYGPKVWRTEQGANKYRRALYTFRFRSVPYPALQAFDTPAGDAPCTRRVRSNTPLQALTTLNEPLFVDCARGLAEATLAAADASTEARIAYAFRRCTGRSPLPDEISALQSFLQRQQARLAAGDLSADTIVSAANRRIDAAYDTSELAAWTLLARVVLNLDETITRQ